MRLRGGATAEAQPRPQRAGRGLKGRGGAGPPWPVWKLLEVSQRRRPGSFRRVCRQRVPWPAGASARPAAGATPRGETPARPGRACIPGMPTKWDLFNSATPAEKTPFQYQAIRVCVGQLLMRRSSLGA